MLTGAKPALGATPGKYSQIGDLAFIVLVIGCAHTCTVQLARVELTLVIWACSFV